MSLITETMTVTEELQRWPATLTVLGSYGLDTCCGRRLALSTAAASAGVDLQVLVAALEQAAGAQASR